MSSEVEICNSALGLVGGNLVTNLDDGTTEANLCKVLYPTARDSVIEERDWTFATARRKLSTPLAIDPAYGYSTSFLIPADTMRLISVYPESNYEINQADYVREGDKILCNESSLHIKYVRRLQDPNKFSPLFIMALTYKLASLLAIPIAESQNMQTLYFQLYQTELRSAGANDGMQGRREEKRATKLTGSRLV